MTPRPTSGPLHIVVVEFLPSGGMYQFSFQFAAALAKAGHRVELLTGPNPELRSGDPNLTVVQCFPTWHPGLGLEGSSLWRKVRRGWRALLLLESWRRALGYLRRAQPDVAQFGELRYLLDTMCFLVLARTGRARAMVDVAHNPVPYDVTGKEQSVEKSGRLTRALLTRAYEACDLVLVLGEGPRDDLLTAFPGVHRVAVCGHGDYASVTSDTTPVPPSSAPPQALFFGAWTKYKNIPLMLEAFALTRAELPEARLTLAGPVMPDVDLGAIEAQARLIGNVDLRPGYVAIADLPELFAAHRVVVFTYETVNISGSVHMAYTFGRPVVATDVGSMRDVVQHEMTGLLAAAEPAAIAAAIGALLRDGAAADRMGDAGRLHAQGRASWATVADKAATAYAETLAGDALSPTLRS